MGLDFDVEVRIKRLKAATDKVETALENSERKTAAKDQKIDALNLQDREDQKLEMSKIRKALIQVEDIANDIVSVASRMTEKAMRDKVNRKLVAEIDELKVKLESRLVEEPEIVDPSLVKASTIAIFDSLLFAIENWSNDGDTAPDFSLACQAVLFPLVYDQVMKGNEHYYLTKVPVAAIEVVKRGREYVKFIRSTCPVGLTDSEAWNVHVPMIAKWWVNDALPLLYGARDPAWEQSSTLDLAAIMSWRDQPASRALEFPLVFDAMDLIDRYREDIRETTNLPDFTRDTLNTRLEAN